MINTGTIQYSLQRYTFSLLYSRDHQDLHSFPTRRSSDLGDKFDVDIPLDEARPEEFDALMIPGGLMNPDELRATHLDSSDRSEEHTSELQSRFDLVCRLLLEKKKTIHRHTHHTK